MRSLLVAALTVAAVLGAVAPALASCRQLSVAEQVGLAPIIAYGTIERGVDLVGPFPSRSVTFRSERVLKGSLPAIAQVRIGPHIPGGAGATSVDYVARAGDHVLYLRVVEGGYETDQCSGSHEGAPTAEETALLGTGQTPAAATLADEIAALDVLPIVVAGAVLLVLAVVIVVLRRRYTSLREGRLSV